MALVLAAPLAAQSFDDLTTFRNPSMPYSELLQVKGGMFGSMAKQDDAAAGLADEIAWDGSVYYHSSSLGGNAGEIDAYAGRDGLVASIRDGKIVGADTISRLQLSAELWPFYREGFYRGSTFVPVGTYEGRNWDAYLGFGKMAAEGLFIEFGPFYGKNRFERNETTASTYLEPDDYKVYGGRVHLEQNTLRMDRRSGLPREGYIATIVAEREWNDSEGSFGVLSGFTTELPSAVWRVRGRMEWYIPQASESAWEVFASAALTDEKDRVVDYEAAHPQGNLWVDAQLRYRLPFSDSFSISPYAHGQFVRILDEDGSSSSKKFFVGFGAEAWLHFSESVSMNAWYSYLDNESRPSVSITEDLHGQHMFFVGMVLRFGSQRR